MNRDSTGNNIGVLAKEFPRWYHFLCSMFKLFRRAVYMSREPRLSPFEVGFVVYYLASRFPNMYCALSFSL